jgi:hypothetical protein
MSKSIILLEFDTSVINTNDDLLKLRASTKLIA